MIKIGFCKSGGYLPPSVSIVEMATSVESISSEYIRITPFE
ncbi:hypothetical protein HMPREF9628_00296 [Peptoanaerobacter stomatis]|uniref:Uncharacterized protein n=1 Tax=Peptoanaerobacter stomatis TaxID=796937 RepID=G9XD57_9FIRM|nr:hypothetical protein [Peptoanaerobacter stomatis]EHL19062.1 hypothetical protein HMPREF9628_00296 [Peptoanaerobacter stomatis]